MHFLILHFCILRTSSNELKLKSQMICYLFRWYIFRIPSATPWPEHVAWPKNIAWLTFIIEKWCSNNLDSKLNIYLTLKFCLCIKHHTLSINKNYIISISFFFLFMEMDWCLVFPFGTPLSIILLSSLTSCQRIHIPSFYRLNLTHNQSLHSWS